MSFVLLAIGPTIDKAAGSSLVYGIDVAGVLAAGDSVSGVSGTVNSGGITSGTPIYTGTVLMVRISGGTVGAVAQYTFTWTTANGDTDSRSIYLRIKAARP